MESLKNWMVETANIMFDDSKNDLRSLPKTVRLQILIVLSFVWSTVFSLYVFSLTSFIWGWAGVVLAHIGLIIAVYITFKFYHKANVEKKSVFETGNYNPAKIFVVFFIIFLLNFLPYSCAYQTFPATFQAKLHKILYSLFSYLQALKRQL